MPIKIPDKLPAFRTLVNEGVRLMTETAAVRQDIRPMQIGLLNLMPNKIKTELQFARLLGATPLQVELSLIRIGNHTSKNTAEEHLLNFYQPWEAVRRRKFDDDCFLGRRQDRALRLRPHGRVSGFGAATPFQDGFDVKAVLAGEETGRRLRRFELGSNSRRRAGAAMKNACHSASSS